MKARMEINVSFELDRDFKMSSEAVKKMLESYRSAFVKELSNDARLANVSGTARAEMEFSWSDP